MAMPERSRYTDNALMIASAIGLVIVGLLAGIAIMLSLDRAEPASATNPVVVERVQLGKQPADTPTAVEEDPLPGTDYSTLFKNAANEVRPAVVFIRVGLDPDGTFDRRFFDDSFQQSVGSGVIVSDAGYIVTNDHVVEGSDNISVILQDKREFPATVVGRDPSTDLAVIRVEDSEPLPVVKLGNSDDLEVGEWVLAIGNPFRLSSTVTAGIVSALGRQVDIIEGSFSIEDFIQTDAAINPGNSGGALVNLKGELVGINTAIATESGVSEGYGFAVPVNLVERIAVDLIAYGEVKRGFLGVSIETLDRELVGRYNFRGVLITAVGKGVSADVAGLRKGDIILGIAGEDVPDTRTLQKIVASQRPGDILEVRFWRKGEISTTNVALRGSEDPNVLAWLNEQQEEPRDTTIEIPVPPYEPEAPIYNLDELGVGLADITGAQQHQFGVERGAYVTYVLKEGVAGRSGLPRDVVVTKLDDAPVADVLSMVSTIRSARGSSVLVEATRRGNVKLFFELDIPSEGQ